jgi:predicted enzyme related to lactoylglutathione lyase
MSINFRLHRIIVPVSDLESGVFFYSNLFHQSGVRVSPGRHYFNLSNVVLCIWDATADGDAEVGVFSLSAPIYIATSDIESRFDDVRAISGTKITETIAVRPWKEKSFYFEDPFGNPLCFIEDATCFNGEFFVS